MIGISIAEALKNKHTLTKLGVITANVDCIKNIPALKETILYEAGRIKKDYRIEEIAKLNAIADSRRAYKAFGKDPSRYRLSAEALHRRILKGQDLYFINNLVDVTNLISLKTHFSLGTYDLEKINGDVIFEIAEQGASYEGINRGILNIECLPAFKDGIDYFGNPTGDSARTMITDNTQKLLMIIISFSGNDMLIESLDLAGDLLEKYANATNVDKILIGE